MAQKRNMIGPDGIAWLKFCEHHGFPLEKHAGMWLDRVGAKDKPRADDAEYARLVEWRKDLESAFKKSQSEKAKAPRKGRWSK